MSDTGAGVPFIGVIAAFRDPAASDAALGPPAYFTQGRYAIGGMPANAHPKVSFALLMRSVRLMLGWWIGGRGKSSPLTAPTLLTTAQRDALR